MLSWFKPRSPVSRTASELYGLIVTAARRPDFYLDGGVPDTKEGRFGLLAMHLAIVLERLRREGEPGNRLGQALIEAFVTDMDDNMREIGIGDLNVPRNVKKAAAALEARWQSYRPALDQFDAGHQGQKATAKALSALLLADLFGDAKPGAANIEKSRAAAAYMVSAHQALAATDSAALLAGNLPDLPALSV